LNIYRIIVVNITTMQLYNLKERCWRCI